MAFSPSIPALLTRLRRAVLQLATITAPFYPKLAELGEFELVQADQLPPQYQKLLAHEHHMTVTVEAFHGSLVDVRVLAEHREGDVYTRSSLLVRQDTGQVVQLGIMRINMSGLSEVVRREIDERATPLGRILIRHNVLRHVKLFKLWRISPGPELKRHLAIQPGSASESEGIYGRSAGIVVEGRPNVELLEIVKA
jgi:hypothetical protein